MSAKRHHTKSRKGCRTCKARKIKCDERKPLCSNCERRFPELEQCEWDIFFNHTRRSEGETNIINHALTPASTLGGSPQDTNRAGSEAIDIRVLEQSRPLDARRLDLRLFYQWTSITSKTVLEYLDHDVMGGWMAELPTLSFEHDFLLDFILALAALHLWCEDKAANASMKSAYHFYHAQANEKHRHALSHVTKSNAKPLFVAAMMTTLSAKLLPQLRPSEEPYDLSMEMFSLIKGTIATYDAVMPFIDEEESERIRCLGPMLFEHGMDMKELSFLTEDARKDIETLLGLIDNRSADDVALLRPTLGLVVSIQFGHAAHEPETWTVRRISMFHAVVPGGFIGLLEKHDTLAMAILARYFVRLKDRQEWFYRGLAAREVNGIAGLMPKEMQWLMEYPLKQLEG